MAEDLEKTIKKVILDTRVEREHLLEILWSVQRSERKIDHNAIKLISKLTGISTLDIEATASFYHFFTEEHAGDITIHLNDSGTSYLAGATEVENAFKRELGIKFGEVTQDQRFGLFFTSCIGMCDQEPAALINDVVFTNLTDSKIASIISQLKSGIAIEKIIGEGEGNNALELIKSEISNNIRNSGEVFFNDKYVKGEALKNALTKSGDEIIAEVKSSGLRGRGGAGFSAGLKWEFCKKNIGDHYVIANIDEGEPGTFKDRILLTQYPQQIFEGMTIAALAIGAERGIIYLRAEYKYLKNYLENCLEEMRKANLLGEKIQSSSFNFDISIKIGAGAYICGEESALIESAEGKRGEPRNRPPFPVEKGFLGNPTVVNNPETFAAVTSIFREGADWFAALGTKESTGTKLFSISGDCERPGVYEFQFGITVEEVLKEVGAKNTFAIQIGGPSGKLISQKFFSRKICFEDLPTGGALTIFDNHRDLLKMVKLYMDFFVEESCGFCIPCRAGNVLLQKTLTKILDKKGTKQDIELLQECSSVMKIASRCGLGLSSSNPVTSSFENFPEIYDNLLSKESFVSTFDMSQAVAESCKYVNRENTFNQEGSHE